MMGFCVMKNWHRAGFFWKLIAQHSDIMRLERRHAPTDADVLEAHHPSNDNAGQAGIHVDCSWSTSTTAPWLATRGLAGSL